MHRVALAVVRAEGWPALWRGTMPTLYRTVPGAALYFPLLNGLQRGMARALPTEPAGTGRNVQNMVAGGTARAIAGAIMSPITLVKARFEVRPRVTACNALRLIDLISAGGRVHTRCPDWHVRLCQHRSRPRRHCAQRRRSAGYDWVATRPGVSGSS